MELLKYSSNDTSELNEARRQLWSSKYMLGMENRNPGLYAGKSFWMTKINQDRAELRKIAHKLRAKLPARKVLKVYKVHMKGEASEFGFWERAHTRGQAINQVRDRYNDCFDIVSVEVADV